MDTIRTISEESKCVTKEDTASNQRLTSRRNGERMTRTTQIFKRAKRHQRRRKPF
ncbi:hypothetical protein TNCV_719931, partial [Trichonephila clavipes]